MINCKVSFIVPVYNVEKYLSRCISSIVEQQFKNFEIILIDDGSTDSSGKLCDQWAEKDERISVIHKKNGGLSSARNAGIKNAVGEYICYVDSDDWIDTDLLSDFVNAVTDDDDVFVYGLRMVTNDDEIYVKDDFTVNTLGGMEALDKFVSNQINGYACNKIVKRSMIVNNNILFPEGRNYEDIPTTYKYFINAKCVKITPKKYYNYFVNNSSSITNHDTFKNLNDFYLSCEDMYCGISDFYKQKNIPLTVLNCFRINLYVQLYIRLGYFIFNNDIDNNNEIYALKKRVTNLLDTEKTRYSDMKHFVNCKKYILYKLHLLTPIIKIKAKKARGYK